MRSSNSNRNISALASNSSINSTASSVAPTAATSTTVTTTTATTVITPSDVVVTSDEVSKSKGESEKTVNETENESNLSIIDSKFLFERNFKKKLMRKIEVFALKCIFAFELSEVYFFISFADLQPSAEISNLIKFKSNKLGSSAPNLSHSMVSTIIAISVQFKYKNRTKAKKPSH